MRRRKQIDQKDGTTINSNVSMTTPVHKSLESRLSLVYGCQNRVRFAVGDEDLFVFSLGNISQYLRREEICKEIEK